MFVCVHHWFQGPLCRCLHPWWRQLITVWHLDWALLTQLSTIQMTALLLWEFYSVLQFTPPAACPIAVFKSRVYSDPRLIRIGVVGGGILCKPCEGPRLLGSTTGPSWANVWSLFPDHWIYELATFVYPNQRDFQTVHSGWSKFENTLDGFDEPRALKLAVPGLGGFTVDVECTTPVI